MVSGKQKKKTPSSNQVISSQARAKKVNQPKIRSSQTARELLSFKMEDG